MNCKICHKVHENQITVIFQCCLRHLTPAASAAMVRITASSAVATYMVMQGLLAGCSNNGYGVTD